MARTKPYSSHYRLLPGNLAQGPRTRQAARLERQTPKYVCNCSNVAVSQDAQCSVRRCIEPLAWNIENASVVAQLESPLFTTIPQELRNLIFEYALTESTFGQLPISASLNSIHRRAREQSQQKDIAKNLLLTCRAIYLETFLLPILLNPVLFTRFDGRTRFMPKAMLPWQFANVQALDLTLQQVALEGDSLYNFLFGPLGWHPEARHKGVLVAPDVGLKDTTGGSCRSCDFTLLPTKQDMDRVPLTAALDQMLLPPNFVPPPSAMRLQRARPLVHLTLRLTALDWWTWTDDPTSTDATQHHLGLEPALGDGSAYLSQRPTCTRMKELAQQRRDGYYPVSRSIWSKNSPGWANIVGNFPDLKTLELILETFGEKKAQLETVIECSKTWRFPITGTHFELAWSGKVWEKRSSEPIVENWEFRPGDWYARSTQFEARTLRFTRRRMAPDERNEDCKVH